MEIKVISGGICAPKGFRAAGIHCGIRANKEKKDLALIVSDRLCSAAAVYTRNKVQASPIAVDRHHLADGKAQAVIVNSGNANACAPNGLEHAKEMCQLAADALGIAKNNVLVSSTGVIGQELNVEPIKAGMPALIEALSYDGSNDAAAAIMTTDTKKKEIAVEFTLGGKTVRMGAIAKGSGMIHPNMGTMLSYITTDAAVSSDMLHGALYDIAQKTFNRVTVDGDTSTNDTLVVMANGLAENAEVITADADYAAFTEALSYVCTFLAKAIAADGEGATKLLSCTVSGAWTESVAEGLAKSVVSSSLTKAAMFGADANWGRVICAMGYSGIEFDPGITCIGFSSKAGDIKVYTNGLAENFDEDLAKKILSESEIEINISIGSGDGKATCWGCDLTYEYVKINGDYRS